jgi:predicted N-acetyltransferase YhbS
VLGHPEYYPRFAFSPSARFGISCEYEVPEEVFMTVELVPGFCATLREKSDTTRRSVTYETALR